MQKDGALSEFGMIEAWEKTTKWVCTVSIKSKQGCHKKTCTFKIKNDNLRQCWRMTTSKIVRGSPKFGHSMFKSHPRPRGTSASLPMVIVSADTAPHAVVHRRLLGNKAQRQSTILVPRNCCRFRGINTKPREDCWV